MPVFLDRGKLKPRLFVTADRTSDAQKPAEEIPDNCIEIALINNMPDLALEQTERQVLKLLDAAAGKLVVRLRLFALRALPRSELGQKHLRQWHYREIEDLTCNKVDALIVTGAEPRAADLELEPYWRTLVEIFDWADTNTISTIFSCLAVHAAVRHFDAIDRRPLGRKCFGVFEFEQSSRNPLLKGISKRFRMPHSRWNQITEDDLTFAGYEVLSKGQAGVDTFIKKKKSLFVFFQGHPEYEAWTLFGEYRRDIARFLQGEQASYPDLPAGYFDKGSVRKLDAFKSRALEGGHKDLMSRFPTDRIAGKLMDVWRSTAAGIYANWLQLIAAQRQRQAVELAETRGSATRDSSTYGSVLDR